MKKLLLAAALVLAGLQPAHAQDASDYQNDQIDAQTSAQDESAAFNDEANDQFSLGHTGSGAEYRGDAGNVIGGIIGGIIGGVIGADRFDRHYPGRGGRAVVCYAQNARGQYFQARGRNPRMAQRRALDQCYSYSRFCQPAGCQPAGW